MSLLRRVEAKESAERLLPRSTAMTYRLHTRVSLYTISTCLLLCGCQGVERTSAPATPSLGSMMVDPFIRDGASYPVTVPDPASSLRPPSRPRVESLPVPADEAEEVPILINPQEGGGTSGALKDPWYTPDASSRGVAESMQSTQPIEAQRPADSEVAEPRRILDRLDGPIQWIWSSALK